MSQKLQEELRGKHFIMFKYDEEREQNLYTLIFDKMMDVSNDKCERFKVVRGDTDNINSLYENLIENVNFYSDDNNKLLHLFNKLVNSYSHKNSKKVIVMNIFISDNNIFKIKIVELYIESNNRNEFIFNNIQEVINFINSNKNNG